MMSQTVGNHTVELRQVAGVGSPWIVRVFRKALLFRKRISSDWFLDGEQARVFVDEIVRELSDHSSRALKERRPGWTLHRRK